MTVLFYCLKAATFPRLQRRADKSEFFFEQEGTESDYETLRTSGTVAVVQALNRRKPNQIMKL